MAVLTTRRPTLTGIVATLGPASESPVMVRKLIQAGVSVFRLNFSHGQLDDHAARLAVVRAAARELGTPTAVLGDLQGPKIRVGVIADPGLAINTGDDVLLTVGATPSQVGTQLNGACCVPCEYAALPDEVLPGQRVLINDGAMRLLAIERSPGDPARSLRCRVLLGGVVTSKKGINLPDSDVKAPAVTPRDWECVEWAVANGVDFLALSFVRRADEVIELRKALAGMCAVDHGHDSSGIGAMIPVVAKIEKPQALAELDSIIEASDAVMVARGDLGVEMDLAQVPIAQKFILDKAAQWGKPCIVATQMLETMIDHPSPTRAEVSDVAHAVFDGADAVMLSGETAVGQYPVLAVEMMHRTIEAAEQKLASGIKSPSPPAKLIESRYRTAALAHGAWHVAHDLGAKLVVCWSQRGGAARYLSQNGFAVPIIAYSSDERETRRMALLRGVTPIFTSVPPSGSLSAWNEQVDTDLIQRGWASTGDPIVMIAGRPLGEQGAANTIAVHFVGNRSTGFLRHG